MSGLSVDGKRTCRPPLHLGPAPPLPGSRPSAPQLPESRSCAAQSTRLTHLQTGKWLQCNHPLRPAPCPCLSQTVHRIHRMDRGRGCVTTLWHLLKHSGVGEPAPTYEPLWPWLSALSDPKQPLTVLTAHESNYLGPGMFCVSPLRPCIHLAWPYSVLIPFRRGLRVNQSTGAWLFASYPPLTESGSN